MNRPLRARRRRGSALVALAFGTVLPVATAAVAVVATAPGADAGTAGTAGTPGGIVSTDFSIKDAGGKGFTDVTYSTTIVSEPTRTTDHYFWADQIAFTAGHVAYIGLQPRADVGGAPQGKAYFSVFGAGTTTSDPNCSQGADGGSGLSCSVPFAYQIGRTYHLDIASTGPDTWTGSVTDASGGTATHIATWTVPSGWGNIAATSGAFTEYYASLPGGCDDLPYALVVNGAPTAENGTIQGSVTGAKTYGGTSGSYVDCSAATFARVWRDAAGSHSETGLPHKPGGSGAPAPTSGADSTAASSVAAKPTPTPSTKASGKPSTPRTPTKAPSASTSRMPSAPPTSDALAAAGGSTASTTQASMAAAPAAASTSTSTDEGDGSLALPIGLGAGSAALVTGFYATRRYRTPRGKSGGRPGGTRRRTV